VDGVDGAVNAGLAEPALPLLKVFTVLGPHVTIVFICYFDFACNSCCNACDDMIS